MTLHHWRKGYNRQRKEKYFVRYGGIFYGQVGLDESFSIKYQYLGGFPITSVDLRRNFGFYFQRRNSAVILKSCILDPRYSVTTDQKFCDSFGRWGGAYTCTKIKSHD
ncbi:hypothetical protein PHYBLDRAFT_165043 [Phycomyces blakesleeanus NRRL 1555(-)]|uniref:Uncharacterized protein n=1 Tax=Phycomyces blakesleeanus (strain ATCC 8743b / DSM 1359 / FGSC 10004 / NBRC 33097 / NRRL 1555) TaxID=763407 RepID=A0A162PW00_PHYB8|nr:hypothetical protein PHYBLDRAFT_165043 [Phycomyces blakesleeanus NRRL 1555(-)]OAD76517.1 hypothetical protein PHYBLDRAFT_165043 [Phycomyces blakesleeanus NRRL 1555(-)]|eukprot:XP_018294557.1 hypothetical protein PHYBLDRAFT_165043 [Phycomyces blakesleeanus NRRL 1555(-)]